MEFISVNRIIVDKNQKQKVVPETIRIKDIKACRPWHPGKQDTFQGDATMLVLDHQKTKHDSIEEGKDQNLPTMLINEKYESFLDRMNTKVIPIYVDKGVTSK